MVKEESDDKGRNRKTSADGATPLSCGSGSVSGTNWGWTAGGGLEYAWSNLVSLKAEYLFADLGNRSLTYPITLAVSQSTTTARFRANIVRFGANFKFGAVN